MANIKLTKALIESLVPNNNKDVDYFDSIITGFYIRVSKSGNKTFYLFYRFEGRQRKYKIGRYGDVLLIDARQKAKDLHADIIKGIDPFKERKKRVFERGIILRKFLDDDYYPYTSKHQKNEGYRTKQIIEHGFSSAMNMSLIDMDIKWFEEWRTAKLSEGKAPSTINRALNAIKSALNSAVRWKAISANPIADVKKLKIDKGVKKRVLNDLEKEKLMKALDKYEGNKYIKTFVTLLRYTGLRPNEAMQLKWADIDMGNRDITVHGSYSKTAETRTAKINIKLMDELKAWRIKNQNETYLFPSPAEGCAHIITIQKPWKSIMKLAGMINSEGRNEIIPYDLRHTFCTNLLQNGVDARTVMDLMGHKDIKTTLEYLHTDDEFKQSAVDLL